MTVLITGGGTGGHLNIARALALECKKRGFSVIYVGSTSGQDKMWFENSEIFEKKYFLDSIGVVNKRGLTLLRALFLQLLAIKKSREILKGNKIDFVISVGGFSAGGASLASVITKTPLFIHEQNAIKGKLNALLTPFARAVFGSFGKNHKNFIRTSYPINDEFFRTARDRSEIKTILFLGGSQGALALNNFALESFKKLREMGISIIHQCGKNDFERVKGEYEKMLDSNIESKNIESSENLASGAKTEARKFSAPSLELFDFDLNMAQIMERADFCVSRAGASSVWEICANGLGAYFVPYPFAAKDHQFYNALFLKKDGLCEIKRQDELDFSALKKYIESVDIARISREMRNKIAPNGAKEIIDKIIESFYRACALQP